MSNKTVTFEAGYETLTAVGLIDSIRAATIIKAIKTLARAYKIETNDDGLIVKIVYPDLQTAEFKYLSSHPYWACVKGRIFEFDHPGDIYMEERITWHDVQLVQQATPLFPAGTVLLHHKAMLEVIAPLFSYKVWFRPDLRIHKIAYPNGSISLFIYHADELTAINDNNLSSEDRWTLLPDGEEADFFRGKINHMHVNCNPKSVHFGSLVVEGFASQWELRGLYRADGTAVVMRYDNGICDCIYVTGTDGGQTMFSLVAPGLAVCSLTGQMVPMPDYSHLFPGKED